VEVLSLVGSNATSPFCHSWGSSNKGWRLEVMVIVVLRPVCNKVQILRTYQYIPSGANAGFRIVAGKRPRSIPVALESGDGYQCLPPRFSPRTLPFQVYQTRLPNTQLALACCSSLFITYVLAPILLCFSRRAKAV
jgi:hypothetical protein